MEATEKIKAFEQELNFIKNDKIKNFAIEAIKLLPDYFFEIPSSSSGKYHPQYASGLGGLLRHTRAAVHVAMELFRLDWWEFTSDEKDLIITALLLHDGWKNGVSNTGHTELLHPIIAANSILFSDLNNLLPEDQLNLVLYCIARHMGQWVNDVYTGIKVLEVPKTKYEKFVHLADYIASRKCLEINFDAEVDVY